MRNTVFFVVLAFLLAGCNGKGPSLELKTKVDVASEKPLPVRVIPRSEEPLPVKIEPQEESLSVKIEARDEEPMPVKMVPDEITTKAFYAFLIAAFATSIAAIAAWRAAYNTKKALDKITNKLGE